MLVLPVSFNALPNLSGDFVFYSFQVHEQNDLPTIDSAALASLSEGLEDIVSLPATTTDQFALPSTPTTVTTPTKPIILEARSTQEPKLFIRVLPPENSWL